MSVEPTNAFSARLAEHIRTVVADPRARVVVGARRRPQAVLMSLASDVPPSIRRILLAGSAAAEAAAACRADGSFAGVSAAAGAVLAWLWDHSPNEALIYLDELIGGIAARAGASAEAVAASLAEALPEDMPRAEANRLIEAAAGHRAARAAPRVAGGAGPTSVTASGRRDVTGRRDTRSQTGASKRKGGRRGV
ncbi:hypothetical protein [Candidatus Mycobacterium methanotrophicum]|uniref:Prevent-host-death protein n=1 Tax=Candidatus Mycobacterium methanotrophicum TaxID=2943498 RepID=A0ABY4QRQ4_9MYCO|nr:hypothetical protein [Candidatus Mycobacterium methanotrophicum]UQX13574.1 hypothetical protein M5I08_25635 [Candidatus Mycobacterium methanotrophicum]